MTIEKKAKAYDEALEIAKKNYDAAQDLCSGSQIGVECFKKTLTYIFPELKESEDKRIREEIIEYLERTVPHHHRDEVLKSKEWTAWLERQSECHISHDDEIMIKQLTEYFTTGHGLQNTNETVVEWLNDVKEKLEKRGEVESDNDDIEAEEKGIREAFNKIEDEKQCKQKPQRMISAEAKEAMYNKPADIAEPKCEESKTKIFDAPTPFEDKLYAFVAACEFLAIPSKIEFILEHSQEILDAAREQIGKEQKSAWSEEDQKIWSEISDMLWEGYKQSGSKFSWDEIRDWIKPKVGFFKYRIQPQPKQEWSEEDEVKINRIVACLENLNVADNDILLKDVDWLKSLRPQNNITDEELAQAKKDAYNDALDKIEYHSGEPTFDDGWSAAIWYLKKRNAQPQSRWKPSDEQMKALLSEVEAWTKGCPKQVILESLYQDLKKLK